jgi:hypothetical protein
MNDPGALSRMVPEDLQQAIRTGWEGLTLIEPTGDFEMVTLVCAAAADRLRGIDRCGLVIGRAPGSEERLLVFGLDEEAAPGPGDGAPPPMTVGIDLGYPEARALVGRLAGQRRLRVLWVAAGDELAYGEEVVDLGDAGAAHLRATAARAAEWHVGVPVPLGLDADEWERAVARAPHLVAGAFAEGAVGLVVPAGVVPEAGDGGELGFSLPGVAGGHAAGGDLELCFRWPGAPDRRARRVALRLDDAGQRRLARVLAGQRQMIVLGADDAGGASADRVRVTLSAATRELIRAAALAAARRASSRVR